MQLLNRQKGAAGGVQAQAHRQRVTSADQEAEELAKKLAAAGGGRRGGLLRKLSPIDAAEEETYREIEQQQLAQRKAASKPA